MDIIGTLFSACLIRQATEPSLLNPEIDASSLKGEWQDG